MPALSELTTLHAPPLHSFRDGEVAYFVDAEAPNWVAVDGRGADLIGRIERGNPTFGALVAEWASAHALEAGKAWLHVHDFVAALQRASLVTTAPVERGPYGGRAASIRPEGLRELWLQINNACNLRCTHCLVSSGPEGDPGLETQQILRVIGEAKGLGLERVYVTGGEPMLRRDFFDIAKVITETLGCELIVLTNATLFAGRILSGLDTLDAERSTGAPRGAE